MTLDEKRAWIQAVTAICSYGVYLVIVLSRVGDASLVETPYAGVLLWAVCGSIVAAIVLSIVAGIASGHRGVVQDQRDREISRFGEHIGQSFVVIGAVGALVLAMLEAHQFWIANAIYLGFTLSAVLANGAKIAAYRWGFQ